MMEGKQNDLMMSVVANPNFKMEDFAIIGFTADNTFLQDRSVYKGNELVRKAFSDEEGNFNEKAFENVYNSVLQNYNIMATDAYNKLNEDFISYHRNDIFAPTNKLDLKPKFKELVIANPDKIYSGISGVSGRSKSIDELAQSEKVLLNPREVEQGKEAKWGDSPNDNFWGYFTDALVLAQYNEDGTHVDPITGRTEQHKKGDLKIGPNGTYYYEKLDGRDVYGKQVLNKMNVFTTDGSFWNKFDFFDSDDINQKSVAGSLAKNAVLVGSMFIPYVGPVIAGLSMAIQVADMAAKVGKMITGSENPTLSNIEGWAKSMNRQYAKTEYAQQHTWSLENIIDSVGDLTAQLREQRAIFQFVPGAMTQGRYKYINWKDGTINTEAAKEGFKAIELAKNKSSMTDLLQNAMKAKGNNAAKYQEMIAALQANTESAAQRALDQYVTNYNKIGELLSKTYMAGLISSTLYEEAIQEGVSNTDAALLTLGRFGAEMALLHTPVGDAIFPELRGAKLHDTKLIRSLIPENKTVFNQVKKETLRSTASKAEKVNWAQKLINKGSQLADRGASIMNKEGSNIKETFLASLTNGFEIGVVNDIEEFLNDIAKQSYNWISDEQKLKPWQNNVDRYGMGMVSGLIGGTLTSAYSNYTMSRVPITSENAIQQLVWKLKNGEIENFYKTLDRVQIGNPYLSTEFDQSTGFFKPGTKNNNQDIAAKKAIRQQVEYLKGILEAEGAKSDNEYLDIQTMKDLRFAALTQSKTAGRFLQEYNSLHSDIVKKIDEINGIVNRSVDSNKNGKIEDYEARRNHLSDTDQKALKETENELAELRLKLQELQEGKRADEFIGDALFEMTGVLSKEFTTPIFTVFAEKKYGKPYNKITDTEKEAARTEFNNFVPNIADSVHYMASLYRDVTNQASGMIKAQEETYLNQPKEVQALTQQISDIYSGLLGQNFRGSTEDWLNVAEGLSTMGNLVNIFSRVIAPQQIEVINNDIQNKINSIDQNFTPEEKIKLRDQYIQEYDNQIKDLVIQNIEGFINPFIQQGFATAETKNQLERIINATKQELVRRAQQWNIAEEEKLMKDFTYHIPDNPYTKQISDLNSLENQLQSLTNTPVEQNLDQFASTIGGTYTSFAELQAKVNDIFADSEKDITTFNLDQDLIDQIQNALWINKLYRAAILGARTDSANVLDIFGYNATVNEVSRKVGKESNLAEIDSHYADILCEDINNNISKLEFLSALYSVNKGQKLNRQERVGYNTTTLIYKRLNSIFNAPEGDPLRDWEGYEDLQNVIKSLVIHKGLADGNSLSLSKDEKREIEIESLKLGDAIYEFFQLNKDKLNNPNQLAQLVSPKRMDLYTKSKELLTETLQNIDDVSVVWWMASRAAVKASDFYSMYQEILDPTSNIVPIATQELAIYNNYANIINGDVFNKFQKAYEIAIKNDWLSREDSERVEILEDLEYDTATINKLKDLKFNDYCLNFLPNTRFTNIVLTEGTPGSGKTSSVFSGVISMLAKYNRDILNNVAVIHGASPESAKSLLNQLKISGKSYGGEEFMKLISPDYTPYIYKEGACKISKNGFTYNSNNKIVGTLQVSANAKEAPSLIIIDEISKFNTYELDAIDKYAKQHGITVIVAGDFDQSGVFGTHTVKFADSTFPWQVSLNRNEFIRSPKLGVSMRSENTVKSENLIRFQYWMNNDTSKQLDLGFFEDQTGIYGDKVYSESSTDDIVKDVQTMINTKDGKIGFIYYDSNSELYKKLNVPGIKEHLEFFEGSVAQGLEGQYYIIDTSSISDIDNTILRDIYTGISRAGQGSILVQNDNIEIPLISNPVKQNVSETIDPQVKANYISNRKNILLEIAQGNPVEITPRTKEVDQKLPEQKEGELEDPTQGEPLSEETSEEILEKSEDLGDPISIVEPPINDVRNIQDYKAAIDTSNETEQPQTEAKREPKEPIKLNTLWHTFNTYELGARLDSDNNVIFDEWSDKRYDGANGLRRIDRILGDNTIHSANDYLQRIGMIQGVILNSTDKNTLNDWLSDYLEIKGLQCNFAMKFSPIITSETDNGYLINSKPNAFDKNINEKSFFNESNDTRSGEVNRHVLVALIENEEYGTLLELPIMVPTNAFTLLQLKENDQRVFPELYNKYKEIYLDALNQDGTPSESTPKISEVAQILLEESQKYPEYQQISDLLELFLFSYGSVARMPDNEWLPSKNMENLGQQFVTQKGELSLQRGYNYDVSRDGWINVQDYLALSNGIQNGRIVATPIMKSLDGYIDNIQVVKPGHPFILISSDPTVASTQDIINQFAEQSQPGYKGIPKVNRYYILPPIAKLSEYIKNLDNSLFGRSSQNTSTIGNDFTPYRIWSMLLNDSEFLSLVEERLPLAKDFLIQKVEELDKLTNNQDIANKLAEPTQLNDYPVTLKYYLSRMLTALAYNKTRQITTLNSEPEHVNILDQEVLNKVDQIMQDNNYSLFHWTVPDHNEGPFVVIKQDNYNIDGKPVMINGKIDSPVFRSEGMSDFLHDVVSRIHEVERGSGVKVRIMDERPYKFPSTIPQKTSTIEYNQLQNIVNKVKDIIPDYNPSVTDPTVYSQTELIAEIDKVVTTINKNPNSKVMALRYNNDILISQEFEGFSNATSLLVLNAEGNEITELTPNSIGTQEFKVIAWNKDNSSTEYNVIYENDVLNITPTKEVNTTTEVVLNITPDNYTQFQNNLSFGDSKVIKKVGAFKKLLEVDNFNDFIAQIDLVATRSNKYVNQLCNDIKANLNTIQDPVLKQQITEMADNLQQLAEFRNPRNKENACVKTIKLKFA